MSLLPFLRSLHVSQPSQDDGELLRRFRDEQDEMAFATLVNRHGPLVLSVAQRVLGQSDSVQDVFQATFLILAQSAPRFTGSPCVAGWLVQVARRTALQARTQAARRGRWLHALASQARSTTDTSDASSKVETDELGAMLDEAIASLPDKYRIPVVLCHLQGFTNEQAAQQLGWPLGTVSGRITRAKKVLQARLLRQGVSLAVVGSILLTPPAQASLAQALMYSTVNLACLAVQSPATLPNSSVTLLASRVVQHGIVRKVGVIAACMTLVGIVAVGSLQAWSHRGEVAIASNVISAIQPLGTQNPTTMAGKVVNDQGQPIAGASVCWSEYYKIVGTTGGKFLQEYGTTDQNGRFRLELPAELAKSKRNHMLPELWAIAPGYNLGVIKGGSSEEKNVITLTSASKLSFVIQNPDGQPLRDAIVEPYHFTTMHATQIIPEKLRAQLQAVTDAAGRVQMPGMPSDNFDAVRVTNKEFGIQQLRLDGREKSPVERVISLREVNKLEGRVTCDDPSAVANIEFHFTTRTRVPKSIPLNDGSNRSRMIWETEGIAVAKTDAKGRFTIPALATGLATIDVGSKPQAGWLPDLPGADFDRDGNHTITIPLVKAAQVTGKILTEDTRQPVADTEIHIGYGKQRSGSTVLSNAQGQYEAWVLPGEVYTQVLQIPQAMADKYAQLGSPWNERQTVEAGVNKQLQLIELAALQAIKGTLLDEVGKPVVNRRLNALHQNRRYGFGTTNEQGEFTLLVPKKVADEVGFEYWHDRHSGPAKHFVKQKQPLILQLTQKLPETLPP